MKKLYNKYFYYFRNSLIILTLIFLIFLKCFPYDFREGIVPFLILVFIPNYILIYITMKKKKFFIFGVSIICSINIVHILSFLNRPFFPFEGWIVYIITLVLSFIFAFCSYYEEKLKKQGF
jgi:hypothetical protein